MGGHLTQMARVDHSEEEALHASCGPVRGTCFLHGDRVVAGYLGIPYAKPPIGELRFKKPLPADIWEDVKDCTKYGPVCPPTGGISSPDKEVQIDEENGLNLNVFAPEWTSPDFPNGLPVMVFIHGGGYELSSSADYHDYSVSGSLPLKDVVLVTFNYRIGVLGFLTTGDDTCRGNLGLWDMTLVLKWVQNHIRSFGGNPANVTLFGHSSGGASTDLLSLSPYSRDLFHKFIALSGTSLCDFAIRTSENQATICKEFAIHHGYTGNDSASLFAWYQSQPIDVLCNVSGFEKSISGFLTFTPNLDDDFLPRPLDELRREAPKKSMMTGVCEYEGLMYAFMDPEFTTAQAGLRKQIFGLFGEDVLPANKKEEYHKKIYESYSKDVKQGDQEGLKKKLVEFVGDYFFNYGVMEAAKSSTKHGNDTYLYSFEFCNPNNFGMFQTMIPFPAATHCTELRYILGEGLYSKFEPDAEDIKMMEIMTTIFTNFAKTGDPGWQKYSLDKPETHYRISYPESGIRDVYQDGRCKYFDEVQEIHKSFQKVVYGKEVVDDKF